MAVGGGSPIIAVKNIIAFLSIIKFHPSAIVIQWPNFHRFYDISTGYHIQHYTPACDASEFYKEILINEYGFKYNAIERNFLLHYLTNIGYKGKIVEFFSQTNDEVKTICNALGPNFETYKFDIPPAIDVARDLGHPGSQTHRLYANRVLKILQEKN